MASPKDMCRWPGVRTTSEYSCGCWWGHQQRLRRRICAAGLVSAPPASIPVVVGEDTNNGFAELTTRILRKFMSNILTDALHTYALLVMVHDDSVIDIT